MPWRHVTYVMWWHIVMSHVMSSWYFVVRVKYFMFYLVFHNSRSFECVDANLIFFSKKWRHFDTSWREVMGSQDYHHSVQKTYSGKVTKWILAVGRVVRVIGKNVLWGVIPPPWPWNGWIKINSKFELETGLFRELELTHYIIPRWYLQTIGWRRSSISAVFPLSLPFKYGRNIKNPASHTQLLMSKGFSH